MSALLCVSGNVVGLWLGCGCDGDGKDPTNADEAKVSQNLHGSSSPTSPRVQEYSKEMSGV